MLLRFRRSELSIFRLDTTWFAWLHNRSQSKLGLEIQVAKISGFVVLLQFIAPENVHLYIHEESQDTELNTC
jgi:hypothetical protein